MSKKSAFIKDVIAVPPEFIMGFVGILRANLQLSDAIIDGKRPEIHGLLCEAHCECCGFPKGRKSSRRQVVPSVFVKVKKQNNPTPQSAFAFCGGGLLYHLLGMEYFVELFCGKETERNARFL